MHSLPPVNQMEMRIQGKPGGKSQEEAGDQGPPHRRPGGREAGWEVLQAASSLLPSAVMGHGAHVAVNYLRPSVGIAARWPPLNEGLCNIELKTKQAT